MISPNPDRDYRILSMFRGTFLQANGFAIRVFDVLRPGRGDNAIGDLATGQEHGSVDILASHDHMRWIQQGAGTLPCAWRDWLSCVADFVVVSQFLDIDEITDGRNGVRGETPWLTLRHCRRKGGCIWRNPHFVGRLSFRTDGRNQSSGETPTRADILRPTLKFAALLIKVPQSFTTGVGLWKVCPWLNPFLMHVSGFPFPFARQPGGLGDDMINHYGQLHMALRNVQGKKMLGQDRLVEQATVRLASNPILHGDIMKLPHLGDIPMYRGPPPGGFRAR